jgi:hypothetical protein
VCRSPFISRATSSEQASESHCPGCRLGGILHVDQFQAPDVQIGVLDDHPARFMERLGFGQSSLTYVVSASIGAGRRIQPRRLLPGRLIGKRRDLYRERIRNSDIEQTDLDWNDCSFVSRRS